MKLVEREPRVVTGIGSDYWNNGTVTISFTFKYPIVSKTELI